MNTYGRVTLSQSFELSRVRSDSLRGSSVEIGTRRRGLAWPLRKDDTHKSRSVNNFGGPLRNRRLENAVRDILYTVNMSRVIISIRFEIAESPRGCTGLQRNLVRVVGLEGYSQAVVNVPS